MNKAEVTHPGETARNMYLRTEKKSMLKSCCCCATAQKTNSRGGAQPPAHAPLEKEDVRPLFQNHGMRRELGGTLLAQIVVACAAQLPAAHGAPELGKGGREEAQTTSNE